MAKDYYVVLGVSVDASPETIRSAYRKRALESHPDRLGERGAAPFRAISEAYRVLSDPQRRASYDRELRRLRPPPRDVRRPEPEPLISDPLAVGHDPDVVRPSLEALLDRIARNFSAEGPTKAEREEPLEYELILDRDEAARGVRIPFAVPVFTLCFGCGGTGGDWLATCEDCGGEGRIVARKTIEVVVPPGVRDGTWIEVSLRSLGIENLWLRIHVRIGS